MKFCLLDLSKYLLSFSLLWFLFQKEYANDGNNYSESSSS